MSPVDSQVFSRVFKWLSAGRETPPGGEQPPPFAPTALAGRVTSHTLASVAIVEDYLPLRGIIRRILESESDLYVIGEANDGLAEIGRASCRERVYSSV